MKKSLILLLFVEMFFGLESLKAQLRTPLEISGYQTLTTHNQMMNFLLELKGVHPQVTIDTIAITSGGKEIPVIRFKAGNSDSKENLRVLFFAQQHGNEHSGKEAMLMLISEIAAGKHQQFMKNIELIIVPMVNPDGSDSDTRRNGQDVDLNRNHLILTAAETRGLHKLVDDFKPHLTLDVHEYYPWDDTTSGFTMVRRYDEQFGIVTNPNVGKGIHDISRYKILPFVERKLNDAGYSFLEYTVGAMEIGRRLRHSTVDIDDGRHGFAINGSLSFIAEGLNGVTSVDSIQRRALCQLTTALSLLEFGATHHKEIRKVVAAEQRRIRQSAKSVCIRMEHVGDGRSINLNLYDYTTATERMYEVTAYHPQVKKLLEVDKPLGYLVPVSDTTLMNFIEAHRIETFPWNPDQKVKVSAYRIEKMYKDTLEEMEVQFPDVKIVTPEGVLASKDYVYVPMGQIKSNMIVLAFEPQSMLGLANYKEYGHLIKQGVNFPIFRVNGKKYRYISYPFCVR